MQLSWLLGGYISPLEAVNVAPQISHLHLEVLRFPLKCLKLSLACVNPSFEIAFPDFLALTCPSGGVSVALAPFDFRVRQCHCGGGGRRRQWTLSLCPRRGAEVS